MVEDLRAFWEKHHARAEYRETEVCLLRNLPKVGVSLFARSGFYPDFILWCRDRAAETTRVVFLDPHGLRQEGVQDNDRFEAIVKLRELGESERFRSKGIALDGYILAPASTSPDSIPGAKGMTWKALEARYPLLRQDGAYVENLLGRTPVVRAAGQ